jgi:hypothetical protein
LANHFPGLEGVLGIGVLSQEPEVTKRIVNHAGAKALATVIADLLNENESLLTASVNGPSVLVREKGQGGRAFTVNVTASNG